MKTYSITLTKFCCAALLFLWLPALSQSAAAKGSTVNNITLIPFVVSSLPTADASLQNEREAEIKRLQGVATDQAERTLTQHRLVRAVERVDQPNLAHSPLIIIGTVSLPVPVAQNAHGTGNYGRHGDYATATATLLLPDGHVVATSHVTLDWRAVWWINAGKTARLISFETMLADFTKKAADKAVRSVFNDPAVVTLNETHH